MCDAARAIRSKRFLARRVLPRLLTLARALTPAFSHVVVAGYPAIEGNSLAMVRALIDRYGGQTVLLDGPSPSFLREADIDQSSLRLVRKASFRGIFAYVTASAVFFTHGLYGEPATNRRKPTVNLWHGDGPKYTRRLFPERTQSAPPADYVVSSSTVWGADKCRASGLPLDSLLMAGNPRLADLARRPRPAQLLRLQIDPEERWVLWLPAYRAAKASGTMRGGMDSTGSTDVVRSFSRLSAFLAQKGVGIAVKPHPMDAASFSETNARIIRDTDLERVGLTLNELISASGGVITDYSSVMTDVAVSSIPIAFFVPDEDDYRGGRGLYPEDILSHLPGPTLRNAQDIEDFARDVVEGRLDVDRRDDFRAHLGIAFAPKPSDAILDAVSSGFPRSRFAARLAPNGFST